MDGGDATGGDAGAGDAGSGDAGTADAGSGDAGADAGSMDGGVLLDAQVDAATGDAGLDAHMADADTMDAPMDASAPDAGSDAGHSTVTVHAVDSSGADIVRESISAYSGAVEVARIVCDFGGMASFDLPPGSYRFAVISAGIPYWSGATDHCMTPACTHVDITVSATTPFAAVTFDLPGDPAYSGGELYPNASHWTESVFYVENWAVADFNTPTAALTDAHPHLYNDCWRLPLRCGNATGAENQHAFGTILQGIFVRLATRGAFDVISVDYRIRDDFDDEPLAELDHVQSIPGIDPGDVEIWIAPTLDVGMPPTMPFQRYVVGTRLPEMREFRTLPLSGLNDVTTLYITSTWNVAFDNVLVRPH